METCLKGTGAEVVIGRNRPTVIIGARINAAGKDGLADSLRQMDMSFVKAQALAQVRAGADIIDVQVAAMGVDEVQVLPLAVRAVAEVVSVPISIHTSDAHALAAALAVCPGKPLVNGVIADTHRLDEFLPLIKKKGAAVIALAMDERVPDGMEERFDLARQVLRECISRGLRREDVIVDPMVLTLGADPRSAQVALEIASRLARIDDVNLTLGASQVSEGLPDRDALDEILIALAIAHGVTCPILDPKFKRIVVAADLLLGRDESARRYTSLERQPAA